MKLSDLKSNYKTSCVYDSVKNIPNNVIEKTYYGDFLTPLKNGKQWLYEYTLRYQPKMAKVLLNSNELLILSYVDDTGYIFVFLLQEISNRILRIERNGYGYNPDDKIFKINYRPPVLYESLPKEIQYSYYYRFNGLDIITNNFFSTQKYLLPRSTNNWESIDKYLGKLKLKKYLSWFEEKFPKIKPIHKYDFYKLKIFLDTRPTLSGKEGDVFFVNTATQDGTIYYIKDADIENMYILTNYLEAIDGYCEHILLNKDGRFDFMPYATKFE